ncbi:MAG: hypothetical protein ACLGIO_14495 [Acidimicrobiia bacterium]
MKRLRLLALGLGLGAVPMLLVAFGTPDRSSIVQAGGSATVGRWTLSDIAASCASSVGSDGFGRVDITEAVHAANETVAIAVPCRLVLHAGASMTLNRIQLSSRHLVIRDDDEPGPNAVRIEHSELRGLEGSGFLLDLHDPSDSYAMESSTIVYDKSVWVRVLGNREDSEGGGSVVAIASTIRSSGPRSEGIQLVAGDTGGGTASFVRLVLETTAEEGSILLAEDCRAEGIVGAPEECKPPVDGS